MIHPTRPRTLSVSRTRRGARRPRIECLEDRQLLATFTVTSIGDLTPQGLPVSGSLRQAILNVNASSDPSNLIKFAIGTSGQAVKINLQDQLPTITKPVTVDGYSQTGALKNSLVHGTNAQPLVILDGTGSRGGASDGLVVNTTGAAIDGLVLQHFQNAIVVLPSASAVISGNFIGVDATGQAAMSNQVGILVQSSDTTIGGPNLEDRNLISGNSQAGILNSIQTTSLGLLIQNNLIGTDSSGTKAVANNVGIEESELTAGQVTISGNVISGNTADGMALLSTSNSVTHQIFGNAIGTTADGLGALGNGGNGITDLHGSFDTIGSTSFTDRNVISGNGGYGIALGNSTSATAHDVNIVGNLIGTDIQGTKALGNTLGGISAAGYNLSIGGSLSGSANVISGNLGDGLILQGQGSLNPTTYGVSIQANNIGVDYSGLFALGNAGAGIRWVGFSPAGPSVDSTIGGLTPVSGNVIGANADGGIVVSGAKGLAIEGNFIGVNRSGQYPLGNFRAGIDLKDGASGVSVGGTVSGASNVIANTQASTVSGVTSGGVLVGVPTSNPILSNVIKNNAGIGIDLGADGPTSNVTGSRSNYPVIDSVTRPSGTTTHVRGTLNGAASTTYLIQVFSSPSTSGNLAQANTLLGSFQVTTDASGNASLDQDLNATYTAGNAVVSTATPVIFGVLGQTSELSPTQFYLSRPADLSVSIPALSDLLETQPGSFTVELRNDSGFDASNVVVLVNLPATAGNISATSSIGSTTITRPSSSVLQFTIPSLPANTADNPAVLTITTTSNVIGPFDVSATIASDNFDPDLSNNAADASTNVVKASNLVATIFGDPASVAPGQTVRYTINVVTRGPSEASSAHLIGAFENFNIQSVSLEGVPQVFGTDGFDLDLGDLPVGALRTAVVYGSASGLNPIQASATVQSSTQDPSPNNTVQVSTNVMPLADLAIVQTASAQDAIVGQDLVYTIRLTNQGPSSAKNVILTDILPTGASYGSASSSDGQVSASQGVVTFLVDHLDPGGQAVLTIIVVPTSAGSITNTASAHSDQFDPVGSNSLDVKLVTAVELAGAFLFSQSTYSTQDDQPSMVAIQVLRVGGDAGAVSVDYSVTAGTAVAGTDFTPVSGTLHFASGQTSQTIQVPIVGNSIINDSKTVIVTLANPTSGATLGAPSSSTLTIVGNTQSSTGGDQPGGDGSSGGGTIGPVLPPAPFVLQVQRFGIGPQRSILNITFSQPMNPGLATDPRSYYLFGTGRDGVLGTGDDTPIRLLRPTYDAPSQTVSLRVGPRLGRYQSYLLLVSGSTPFPVTGSNGLALDGNYDGLPGGNYLAIVNQVTYNPPGSFGVSASNPSQIVVPTPGQPDSTHVVAPGRLRAWQAFLKGHKHPRSHR